MIAEQPRIQFGDSIRRLIQTEMLGASTLRLGRRDVAYSCLDDDRSVYLVEHGQIKAVAPARNGKECLFAIYTAGDVFGEQCLIGGARMETAIAMAPTVLKRLSSTRLLAALGDAGLRAEFVRFLTYRLAEQQRFITELITADGEYRLAAILLYLARKLGKRDGHLLRIEGRITQEELSGMVGTTRSRVGYFLKRFCQAGLIARSGNCFLIVNEPRLYNFLMREPVLPQMGRHSVLRYRPTVSVDHDRLRQPARMVSAAG
ncbi:MAG TPA: Crp/Fnr family transcriptional regulator [Micromonosporaceae bacterium]